MTWKSIYRAISLKKQFHDITHRKETKMKIWMGAQILFYRWVIILSFAEHLLFSPIEINNTNYIFSSEIRAGNELDTVLNKSIYMYKWNFQGRINEEELLFLLDHVIQNPVLYKLIGLQSMPLCKLTKLMASYLWWLQCC